METTTSQASTVSRSTQYTLEEQANYCKEWQRLKGHMTRIAFCKKIGISTKTLRRWLCSHSASISHKPDFIPLSGVSDTTVGRLQMVYPNGVKLSVPYCADKSFQCWIQALVQCV